MKKILIARRNSEQLGSGPSLVSRRARPFEIWVSTQHFVRDLTFSFDLQGETPEQIVVIIEPPISPEEGIESCASRLTTSTAGSAFK